MRMMGVAGFLIPLVSIARRGDAPAGAALALRPPRQSRAQAASCPASRVDPERGFWARLARSIMRRPCSTSRRAPRCCRRGGPGLLRCSSRRARPSGIPRTPQSVHGFDCCSERGRPGRGRAVAGARRRAAGADVLAPAVAGRDRPARRRARRRDPEVAAVYYAAGRPLRRRDAPLRAGDRRRAARLRLPGARRRSSSGCAATLIPAARFPAGVERARRRRPAAGRRLPPPAYTLLPAAVARGARPHLLPAHARVPLAAPAAEGGAAEPALGRRRLRDARRRLPLGRRAATLARALPVRPGRGLDPDLPVRDAVRPLDGLRGVPRLPHARDLGRERTTTRRRSPTGSRRPAGSSPRRRSSWSPRSPASSPGAIVGLQEFGVGLAVAIFIDATIVRALLVPSLMALFGRWNWWLPRGVARIFRVRPSPLPAEN